MTSDPNVVQPRAESYKRENPLLFFFAFPDITRDTQDTTRYPNPQGHIGCKESHQGESPKRVDKDQSKGPAAGSNQPQPKTSETKTSGTKWIIPGTPQGPVDSPYKHQPDQAPEGQDKAVSLARKMHQQKRGQTT